MELPKLQPMTVPQILWQSLKVCLRNIFSLLGIYVLVHIPYAALRLAYVAYGMGGDTTKMLDNAEDWKSLILEIPQGIFLEFLAIVIGFVFSAGVFKSVSEYYLSGKRGPIAAYRGIWPRMGTLLMAAVLHIGLLLGGLAAMALLSGVNCALSILLFRLDAMLLSVIPMLLFFGELAALAVLAIVVLIWLSLTVQCIMAEQLSAWKGMKRSRELTKRCMGRVFAIGLILMGASFLATWLLGWDDDQLHRRMLWLGITDAAILRQIRYMLVSLLFVPFGAVVMAHVYFDLVGRKDRVRTEVPGEVEESEAPEIPWPDSWAQR